MVNCYICYTASNMCTNRIYVPIDFINVRHLGKIKKYNLNLPDSISRMTRNYCWKRYAWSLWTSKKLYLKYHFLKEEEEKLVQSTIGTSCSCSLGAQLDPQDDPLKFTKSFIQMVSDMSSLLFVHWLGSYLVFLQVLIL